MISLIKHPILGCWTVGVSCGVSPLSKYARGFKNGPPREIRTPDTQVRSLVLYPAELWAAQWRRV